MIPPPAVSAQLSQVSHGEGYSRELCLIAVGRPALHGFLNASDGNESLNAIMNHRRRCFLLFVLNELQDNLVLFVHNEKS